MGRLSDFFPSGRDRGVTVAVDGFFALAWFGWGQADPPATLVVPLAIGSGLAAVLTVAGVLASRRAGSLPAWSDPVVRRRYRIVVAWEFGLLGIGAAVLGLTGQAAWIPVWVCFGVGVHFFPLARALSNLSLRPLGVVLIDVALAALIVGLTTSIAPSAITGIGAGASLLAFGIATCFIGRRASSRVLGPA